jgi:hypothetical protein
VGDHALSASYAAQGNFAASSATGTLHVNPAPTSASISAPTITYNANGLVTVTVSSGALTPTGNVSLSVDYGGATTQALVSGSATFTIPSPSAGDHALSANYGAQGNFAASSAAGMLHVNKRATATTVTFGTNPTNEGSASSVIVTVADIDVSPKINPAGTAVTLSGNSPSLVFGSTTCTLVAISADAAACYVSVTPADNGSYTIAANFPGSSAHVYSSGSNGLAVTNVSPSITTVNVPTGPFALGTAVNIAATANFTDPGVLDTHTCTIGWDDPPNSPPVAATVAESNGNGSCSGTHTFNATGVYGVYFTITDKDGGNATTSATPTFVVVYDPNGGFVTGGGWINSPAGAMPVSPFCSNCSGLTGKANFGFVSKYLKGATVPTGQTEFQFQVASFNFHSEVYQWLVVSGPKAQYKGTGTVNGTGNYGFLLTATDGQLPGGGVDQFRIKIWDINNGGAIVYDNVPGASDDINSNNTQALGGGSIVIHK